MVGKWIVPEWNGYLEIVSRPQAIGNIILGNICFSEQMIYRKQSLAAPVI